MGSSIGEIDGLQVARGSVGRSLAVPVVPAGYVSRPRLMGALSTGAGLRLTLVDAPTGQVFATYTASTDNGACSILATEVDGGTANDTVIYQGSSDQDAPSITQSSPASLTADGSSVTFTATAQNPSGAQELDDTQDSVFLSGDDTGRTTGLDASQVTLSYSDDATSNAFVPVALTGTTVDGGYIEGDIDPTDVTDFPAGSSETVTFKMTVASGAADSVSTGTPLTIESDLDQLNEADGSTSNVS
jgi:hypothetical protein